MGSITYTGINATLTSPTVGVSVTVGSSAYGNLAPLAVAKQQFDVQDESGSRFCRGHPIGSSLGDHRTRGRSTDLLFTLPTGTPVNTALLSDNFDALPLGDLDRCDDVTGRVVLAARRRHQHDQVGRQRQFHRGMTAGGGNKTLSWRTMKRHARFDGRSHRTCPSVSTYGKVTLDFRLFATTSRRRRTQRPLPDDGWRNVSRIMTGGTRIVRSVLAEAFAESITRPGQYAALPASSAPQTQP